MHKILALNTEPSLMHSSLPTVEARSTFCTNCAIEVILNFNL